jgi:hypothetical protein
MPSKWPTQFMYALFGMTPPEAEERHWIEDYARAKEDRAIAEAVVKFFNMLVGQGREPWFVPTVKAAILARHPWLIVLCQSCDTVIDLDMRMKPRHAAATILMPFSEVRCPRCNGHGRPTILRLAPGPMPTVSKPPYMPRRRGM